jgi:hypothetical protein
MARVVQFEDVLGTDSEGHLDSIAEKFAFDLGFQGEAAAIGFAQQSRYRTGITQFAPPGSAVVGVGVD